MSGALPVSLAAMRREERREKLRSMQQDLIDLRRRVEEARARLLPDVVAVRSIRELAKSYTLDAVAALVEALSPGNDVKLRLEAAKTILAYAWGKPREMAPEAEAPGQYAQMTTEELTITLRRTLQKIAAEEPGAAGATVTVGPVEVR